MFKNKTSPLGVIVAMQKILCELTQTCKDPPLGGNLEIANIVGNCWTCGDADDPITRKRMRLHLR